MSETTYVFFASLTTREPVYHQKTRWSWNRGWSQCGTLKISSVSVTSMHLRHARAIGRPCKFCWAEGERPRPLVPTSHALWRAVQP